MNLLDIGQIYLGAANNAAERRRAQWEMDRADRSEQRQVKMQDREIANQDAARTATADRNKALFEAIRHAKETGDTSMIHQIDPELGLKYDDMQLDREKYQNPAKDPASTAQANRQRAAFEFNAARQVMQDPTQAPAMAREAERMGADAPGEHLLLSEDLAGPQVFPDAGDVATARGRAEATGAPIDAPSSTDLRKEVMGSPVFKAAQEVKTAWQKIQGAPPNPAGDISLLYGFMKLQDPGSTVREGEYATAANAQGVPEWVRLQWNKMVDGDKLGDAQRRQFKNEAGRLYSSQRRTLDPQLGEYRRIAQQEGVDPDSVVLDVWGARAQSQEPEQPQAPHKRPAPRPKPPPHLAGFTPSELDQLRKEAAAGDPAAQQLLGAQ